jgi:hypothetical protein
VKPKTLTVAILAVVVLAGCTGSPGGGTATDASRTNDPTTDSPTPDDPTTVTPTRTPSDYQTPPLDTRGTDDGDGSLGEDGYANMFEFEATKVTPEGIAREVADAPEDLHDEELAVYESIRANGSATVQYLSHADGLPDSPGPLDEGDFVREDGQFYRVESEVVDRRQAEGFQFDLEGPLREDERERANDSGTVTEFGELSATQTDLFTYAMPNSEERECCSVLAGFYYLPPDGESLDGSGWLDGDPHYVEHLGDLFRVQFDGDTPPVVRMQVRYDLEPVADSASEFVAPRLEELVTNVTESEPPAPGRSVIRSAIENGTYEWSGTVSTRPEAVESAANWLRDHTRYLRYEGELYRVTVMEAIE